MDAAPHTAASVAPTSLAERAAPPAGWAFLPPLQRQISDASPATLRPSFVAALPTRLVPAALGTMGHLVDPGAPAGTIAVDDGAPAAPVQRAVAAELTVLHSHARSSAPGKVQDATGVADIERPVQREENPMTGASEPTFPVEPVPVQPLQDDEPEELSDGPGEHAEGPDGSGGPTAGDASSEPLPVAPTLERSAPTRRDAEPASGTPSPSVASTTPALLIQRRALSSPAPPAVPVPGPASNRQEAPSVPPPTAPAHRDARSGVPADSPAVQRSSGGEMSSAPTVGPVPTDITPAAPGGESVDSAATRSLAADSGGPVSAQPPLVRPTLQRTAVSTAPDPVPTRAATSDFSVPASSTSRPVGLGAPLAPGLLQRATTGGAHVAATGAHAPSGTSSMPGSPPMLSGDPGSPPMLSGDPGSPPMLSGDPGSPSERSDQTRGPDLADPTDPADTPPAPPRVADPAMPVQLATFVQFSPPHTTTATFALRSVPLGTARRIVPAITAPALGHAAVMPRGGRVVVARVVEPLASFASGPMPVSAAPSPGSAPASSAFTSAWMLPQPTITASGPASSATQAPGALPTGAAAKHIPAPVQRAFGLPTSLPSAPSLPSTPDLSSLAPATPSPPYLSSLASQLPDVSSADELRSRAAEAVPEAADATNSASDTLTRAGQALSPGAPAGSSSAATENVEQLVRKLYGPLVRRIKAELLLDRERRGIRIDGI